MLLLGFELHDVLRVVVGVVLVFLTVFRRELSCNRGYHPDDEQAGGGLQEDKDEQYSCSSSSSLHNNDCDGDHGTSSSKIIRRRKSSSALPSLSMASSHDADGTNNCGKNKEDPTEEILESAGLFLSGGPFLAVGEYKLHLDVVVGEEIMYRCL